jgi:hypothetical protein
MMKIVSQTELVCKRYEQENFGKNRKKKGCCVEAPEGDMWHGDITSDVEQQGDMADCLACIVNR